MTATLKSTAPSWVAIAADVVVPAQRADVTMSVLDDESVLFDPKAGAMYYLNQTAARVWKGCDGVATTREMARMQVARYRVAFDDALDHVEQVVAWLAECRLLQTVDVPEAYR